MSEITITEQVYSVSVSGGVPTVSVADSSIGVVQVSPVVASVGSSTLSSVGDGASLVKTGSGLAHEIKSIKSSDGKIAVTSNTNDVNITVNEGYFGVIDGGSFT